MVITTGSLTLKRVLIGDPVRKGLTKPPLLALGLGKGGEPLVPYPTEPPGPKAKGVTL